MDIDNHDMCSFGIIASLKARKGIYEKVVIHRGVPMLVKKNWFERWFTFERKEKEAETVCSPVQQ